MASTTPPSATLDVPATQNDSAERPPITHDYIDEIMSLRSPKGKGSPKKRSPKKKSSTTRRYQAQKEAKLASSAAALSCTMTTKKGERKAVGEKIVSFLVDAVAIVARC